MKVRVIEASTFQTRSRPDDTFTERVIMNVNGHIVQVLRYDYSDSGVIVVIDGDAEMMRLDEVDGYIRSHAK